MKELFEYIIVVTMWSMGVRIITSEGMIFGFIGRFFNSNDFLKYIGKPICRCITCMASIHGVIIYFALFRCISLTELIVGIISASFVQTLIWNVNYFLTAKVSPHNTL